LVAVTRKKAEKKRERPDASTRGVDGLPCKSHRKREKGRCERCSLLEVLQGRKGSGRVATRKRKTGAFSEGHQEEKKRLRERSPDGTQCRRVGGGTGHHSTSGGDKTVLSALGENGGCHPKVSRKKTVGGEQREGVPNT